MELAGRDESAAVVADAFEPAGRIAVRRARRHGYYFFFLPFAFAFALPLPPFDAALVAAAHSSP